MGSRDLLVQVAYYVGPTLNLVFLWSTSRKETTSRRRPLFLARRVVAYGRFNCITKDSSLASLVLSSNMAAVLLSFGSQGNDCKQLQTKNPMKFTWIYKFGSDYSTCRDIPNTEETSPRGAFARVDFGVWSWSGAWSYLHSGQSDGAPVKSHCS